VSDEPTPLPNSYWLEPGRILCGQYPGGRDEAETQERLRRLLETGIDYFIDLTETGEREPYEPLLPVTRSSAPVAYRRLPIPDHGLPQSLAHMQDILDELDKALAEGRCIYLHCRAGIGRTNLVAGCWLVNRGFAGEAALAQLNERWQGSSSSASWPSVPETEAQCDFVREWRPERDAGHAAAADTRDRVRGMLLGLAAAEALGHATHGLPAGAWADKTAMTLCLADSFIACGGHNPGDQVQRYQSWLRTGLWSSTGVCVGASAATVRALAAAQWTGNPLAGSHDPARAEAEPLARIGPAVAWHRADPRAAIEAAVLCARITHQAPLTLDAVRYVAALLVGALAGEDKRMLLAPMYAPAPGLWDAVVLKPRVRDVALGSWRGRKPNRLVAGSRAAAYALESALSAFDASHDPRQCIELAASRGGDAATAAAIVGQLAGAHYGASALPGEWLRGLARRAEIQSMADALQVGARG
jgi:ADP-ribosylglycohydrolase/protein-tyrosine phosphatase